MKKLLALLLMSWTGIVSAQFHPTRFNTNTDENAAAAAAQIVLENTVDPGKFAVSGEPRLFMVLPGSNTVSVGLGPQMTLGGDTNLHILGVGALGRTNYYARTTAPFVFDAAVNQTATIFLLTNAPLVFSNVNSLSNVSAQSFQINVHQRTNGSGLVSTMRVAGGLLHTNGIAFVTSNANATDIIIGRIDGTATNLILSWQTNCSPYIDTNSLETAGGGGGGGSSSPLITGAIVYYKLDENTGTTAADATGNGHTATLNGGTSWGAAYIGASSVVFNGTTGYLQGDSTTDTEPGAGDFSIMAWFKTSDSSANRTIINKSGGNGTYYRITLINTSGAIGCNVQGEHAGSSSINNSTINYADNNWHLVVMNIDGSNQSSIGVSVSMDGGSFSSATGTVGPVDPGGALQIGKNGSGEFWDGSIDEVAEYARLLTSDEAASLFNQTHP